MMRAALARERQVSQYTRASKIAECPRRERSPLGIDALVTLSSRDEGLRQVFVPSKIGAVGTRVGRQRQQRLELLALRHGELLLQQVQIVKLLETFLGAHLSVSMKD
jgi:hypothetical protein